MGLLSTALPAAGGLGGLQAWVVRAEYVRAKWDVAVQQTATAGRAAPKLAVGESGLRHQNYSHEMPPSTHIGASPGLLNSWRLAQP